MPLPVSHALLGASIVAAAHPSPFKRYSTPLLLGALWSNVADFDFLFVFAFHSRAWHRSFTHSVVFALLVFLLLILYKGRRRIKEATVYGLAFASHGILDYLTTKVGGGVVLLWPFSNERLGLGWFGLSEVPSKLSALEVMMSALMEFAIFAPLLVVILISRRYVTANEQR